MRVQAAPATAGDGTAPAVTRRRARWRVTFAALQHPNYRLWFFGQMASLFGTWMQSTAQGFLVYQLTHSPGYLGLVGFANGLPTWLFSLYAGVVADRVPRRRLMMICQGIWMILAFVLAFLTFTGRVQPFHVIILAFCTGTINAFDAPTRQSFVLEMVPREDLTNAIALNSTMFNMATAVGPAAGGFVYALLGPAWCFAINGVSFVAVLAALGAMKLKPFVPRPRTASALHDLQEGLRYAISHRTIRTLIGLIAAASMFGLSFSTMFPAWSVSILKGDAATNGLLQSFRGIGAVVGSITLASLSRLNLKGKILTLGTFVYPLFMAAFAFSRWLPLSLALLVCIGGSMILVFNLANALVQTTVPDELRGRVMSIYTLIFLGFFPVGSLLMGAIAEHAGVMVPLLIGAGASLAVAMLLWSLAPDIRSLK